MPRPHIEFIHAQDLPWQSNALPGALNDLDCKVLSSDAESGACSVIVKIPPGWSRQGIENWSAAQEFFVLDGAVDIGSQTYGMDAYGYLPSGFTRQGQRSAQGAVILAFFDATPEIRPGPGAPDPTRPAIPHVNLHEEPWTSDGIDPELLKGRIFVHKLLRYDPVRGDKTVMLNASAHSHPPGWKQRQLHHPCVEEFFILAGDITGPEGIMTAGAYFWRPPGIAHGPFGSRTGYLAICRFVDGHHVNIWHEEYLPYTYAQPFNPVLPDTLRRLARPRMIAPY